jgi:hypothetical protein
MATPAEQWRQEGLQQGLQQGFQQGERQMLVKQVRRRFGEDTARQSEVLLTKITDNPMINHHHYHHPSCPALHGRAARGSYRARPRSRS